MLTKKFTTISFQMSKLAYLLNKKGIPFENEVDFFGSFHLVYPSLDSRFCSVICHEGSYGYNEGLLEIMGLTEDNDVEGFLTAEDVFLRISSHYEKNAI